MNPPNSSKWICECQKGQTAPHNARMDLRSFFQPKKQTPMELQLLRSVLERPDAQRGLVRLYAMSQSECKRNGTCGMEIGMAREKDQTALLGLYLGDDLNADIDNTLPEDFHIRKEKFSIKHSSSKIGTPFKAKWTSADKSVEEDLESLLDADHPHLLLTYIDVKAKKVTMICITAEHNKHTIKTLGREAFKIPKGNSRGIEYSTKAMQMLLSNRYFTIEISDADIDGGEDPIKRRKALLASWGCGPESAAPSSQ